MSLRMMVGFMGLMLFTGCAGIPKGMEAVKPFDPVRYMGKWVEIARMDFRFERNLINTTAHYSFNEDGSIKVVNCGYHVIKKTWKQATGKAKQVSRTGAAQLKVSFFGPFYSGYNVIALDKDYQYALVAGESLDYLWILSRQPTIPDTVKQSYLNLASRYGFAVNELIWVQQD